MALKVKVSYGLENGKKVEQTKVINDLPNNY